MTALSAQVFAEGSESQIEDGDTLVVVVGGTASGASPTLLVGQLGALPILDAAGNVPPAGFLAANQRYLMTYQNGNLYALQPPRNQANVTATSDGLTTGIIPANASWINFTSASAANFAVLPAGKAGVRMEGWVGANGFKLRTVAGGTETINNVNSVSSSAVIPANVMLVLNCVADAKWLLQTVTALGAVATAIVPS